VNRKLAGLLIVLVLCAVTACAAEIPAKKAPAVLAASAAAVPHSTSAAASGNVEEGQKIAEMQAVFTAGEFDKAIEAANTFLKTARDEASKTEAFRIIAEAYRKKGDWRQAAPAYQRLRERYEKSSADWMRCDAIAEIMRNSVNGVYQPAGAPAAKAPAAGQTLADDAVLAEAVTRLAGFRMSRMKSRIGNILRGTTPQLVMAAFEPVAEEAKLIYGLSADAPVEGPREVCVSTGNRLQTLGTQTIAALKVKLEKAQMLLAHSYYMSDTARTEVKAAQNACKEMAEGENRFQQALSAMAGKGEWAGQARLQKESSERRASYEQLAKEFTPRAGYYYY